MRQQEAAAGSGTTNVPHGLRAMQQQEAAASSPATGIPEASVIGAPANVNSDHRRSQDVYSNSNRSSLNLGRSRLHVRAGRSDRSSHRSSGGSSSSAGTPLACSDSGDITCLRASSQKATEKVVDKFQITGERSIKIFLELIISGINGEKRHQEAPCCHWHLNLQILQSILMKLVSQPCDYLFGSSNSKQCQTCLMMAEEEAPHCYFCHAENFQKARLNFLSL